MRPSTRPHTAIRATSTSGTTAARAHLSARASPATDTVPGARELLAVLGLDDDHAGPGRPRRGVAVAEQPGDDHRIRPAQRAHRTEIAAAARTGEEHQRVAEAPGAQMPGLLGE